MSFMIKFFYESLTSYILFYMFIYYILLSRSCSVLLFAKVAPSSTLLLRYSLLYTY